MGRQTLKISVHKNKTPRIPGLSSDITDRVLVSSLYVQTKSVAIRLKYILIPEKAESNAPDCMTYAIITLAKRGFSPRVSHFSEYIRKIFAKY